KTMTYENFQNLGNEEKTQETGPGERKGGMESPECALSMSARVSAVVSHHAPVNSQLRRDLGTLRATLDNITSNTKTELQALTSRGDSLQERISSLKVEVEDHRQELLAGEREALVSESMQRVWSIQQLGKDLKTLTCQLASLKNGSKMACCPLHWVEHEGSCYWFSQSGKSWPDADKHCELQNSHLVVVNSLEEQKFIHDHKGPAHTWMGLTDQNGPWRWVDGTDFDNGFKNWKPLQPDNWYGHGLGGGEDCAHFSEDDGRWNDDVCQRLYRWICETELGKGS
uniref:C-type lectin domain-containing protein n=1 Tax=Peromyscus maniculatus bairdii TaxID=230844 RepID=A0A8C8W844_PERMB